MLLLALGLLCVPATAAGFSSGEVEHFELRGVGTTPGVDYTQLETSLPVELEGRSLRVALEEGWWCSAIPQLPTGQTYTLIRTTAALSGTYDGVPDGGTVISYREGHDCEPSDGPPLRIEYHEEGPVQTVTATVEEGSPIPVSSVQVQASGPAQVNQPISVSATVTTSPAEFASGPIGYLTIDSGPGEACREPVSVSPPVLTVTCTLPAYWGGSVTAFLEGLPGVLASSHERDDYSVEEGETTTAVSQSAVTAEGTTSYVATVTPRYLGDAVPNGSVQFSQRIAGETSTIPGCEHVEPTVVEGSAVAVCATTAEYPAEVRASYSSFGQFTDSESPWLATGAPPPAAPPSEPAAMLVTPTLSSTVVSAPMISVLSSSATRSPSSKRRRPSCVRASARHDKKKARRAKARICPRKRSRRSGTKATHGHRA